jgi:hypothetical protein
MRCRVSIRAYAAGGRCRAADQPRAVLSGAGRTAVKETLEARSRALSIIDVSAKPNPVRARCGGRLNLPPCSDRPTTTHTDRDRLAAVSKNAHVPPSSATLNQLGAAWVNPGQRGDSRSCSLQIQRKKSHTHRLPRDQRGALC